MGLKAQDLTLYLVTDPILCPGPLLIETVTAAVKGGVSFVQLRDKDATTSERVDIARALKTCLRETGVPLVINDDLDAAIAADVDGVHIGQDDIAVEEARARLGAEKIVGLSCENATQVKAVNTDLVDYLGLGTVFATSTKADHKPTIGLSGLAEMARLSPVPSVAIGGLKVDHAKAVLRAGCDGMAVVSAICGQPNPKAAAKALSSTLKIGEEPLT